MIRKTLLALSTLAVAAQEPTTMGLTLRASRPSDNLKDTVGAKNGYGVSLDAESDLIDAWKSRLVIGFDTWGPGNGLAQAGVRGKVTVGHLSLEGVRMLGPEGRTGFLGPYVVIGFGAYGWNVSTSDPANELSMTRRVIHLGGSAGLGYRFTKGLDAEVRIGGGKVDPQFTAAALSFGLTFRY
jgi:hypothetical protein